MAVRLFIGNLPYGASEADLRAHFSAIAEPSHVVMPVDRETGRPRGFAFVEFAERDGGGGSHQEVRRAAVPGPQPRGQRSARARGLSAAAPGGFGGGGGFGGPRPAAVASAAHARRRRWRRRFGGPGLVAAASAVRVPAAVRRRSAAAASALQGPAAATAAPTSVPPRRPSVCAAPRRALAAGEQAARPSRSAAAAASTPWTTSTTRAPIDFDDIATSAPADEPPRAAPDVDEASDERDDE